MTVRIECSDDPAWVLTKAQLFLASQPVRHNLILTLLRARAARPEPGRYWVALNGDKAVGVVIQSPLNFAATLTPMEPEVVAAMVEVIAKSDVALPGVIGEAAPAACFAGQWTEHRKTAAVPSQGQRIYEVVEVEPTAAVSGHLRKVLPDERGLAVAWTRGFQNDIGEPGDDPEPAVVRRLAAGTMCMWDDSGPVSMAAHSDPVEGVVRVQLVYTPPENRNRGYAGALVGHLSNLIHDRGHRCILYTDLGNTSSNSIYRRIGYRAVAEGLRYRFD